MAGFNLTDREIHVPRIHRNLSPAALYQEAMKGDTGTAISDMGALIAYSAEKTGRSPNDKRVVRHSDSEGEVWWGSVYVPIEESTFI